MKVYLVGVGMGDEGTLTGAGRRAIESCQLLIGAKRLLEPYSDHPAVKRPLVRTAEIVDALAAAANEGTATASVLFSGDTGFYSGASTLLDYVARDYPEGAPFDIEVIPGISSLQCFCSRLGVSWDDARILSVHGRTCDFVSAVRENEKTFLLTGGSTKVHDVCCQLVEAGLGDVHVDVGERLSYEDERLVEGSAAELSNEAFADLAVMLVRNDAARDRSGKGALVYDQVKPYSGGVAHVVPRLLIAAPASGGGKTTFTCGLLHTLVRRGLRPLACKCGPDYIDPMFHDRVIGAKSRNLDLFFASEQLVRQLLVEDSDACDVTVIEGVMGYYDGIAVSDAASAWDVARSTDTPAVLVVDGRGRARSIAAEVMGFMQLRSPSNIAGVVVNRVSASLYPRLKELIESECGVHVYGYLPKLDDCSLESRHLGLVLADEVADLRQKLDVLADTMDQTVDVDGLLELARGAAPICVDDRSEAPAMPSETPRSAASPSARALRSSSIKEEESVQRVSSGTAGASGGTPSEAPRSATSPSARALRSSSVEGEEGVQRVSSGAAGASGGTYSVRIAVARDAAFCFYYADALRMLEKFGAQLVEFSPISDRALPEGISGLYLGGGYPELHASELSENDAMLASMRAAIEGGMPTVAECGGFMYLHESMEDADGAVWPMVGIVSGQVFRTPRLGRFGYVTLTAKHDGLLAEAGDTLQAHEFHYWDSTNPGDAFSAQKPQSTRGWECCISTDTLHAGYPHLYFPGNPKAAQRFVEACRRFADR